MADPTRSAVGTWSGGRFMHFGEPLDDERLIALLRPGDGIGTVITADAYGAGEADALLGRALQGVPRDGYCLVGVAPGPANGFTLDMIDCLERFGEIIDWGMVILNPLEPWPGELVLDAARRHDVQLITRVVDYGGLFHGDLRVGGAMGERDHRAFRPAGWVEAGAARIERMRPIAERHGLTMLQLACQWNLAHAPVRCVVPTLIQEAGADARPVEEQRAELAALPAEVVLTAEEVAELRAIGDNTGSMALKGGVPDHEGESKPDRWALDEHLAQVAGRWGIDPARDLQPA
jgi:aryl-alcohol dehydrogenase-like predicted oxidoreductase